MLLLECCNGMGSPFAGTTEGKNTCMHRTNVIPAQAGTSHNMRQSRRLTPVPKSTKTPQSPAGWIAAHRQVGLGETDLPIA